MKSVRPSSLLVVVLSATTVQLEGMAGIGNRPSGFQTVTLALAIAVTGWRAWIENAETQVGDKKTPTAVGYTT